MNILDQLLEEAPPAAPPTPPVKASSEQLAIFQACRESADNLLVNAVAGSGKTWTICEATKWAMGSSLFLAFNKAIAEELRTRIGGTADVKTLNGLGFGVFRRYRPSAELDDRKVLKILQSIMPEDQFNEFGYRLKRAVSLAKSNAFGIDRGILAEDFSSLIQSYDLEVPFEQLEEFSHIALKAFEISLTDTTTLDFDDQIYVPLQQGWNYKYWSNVFVDEDQDLNPIQHLALQRLRNAGARIIGVGDRWQAIYGFRGALTNSVDLLKEKFKMLELPLSTSYRCSQSVVNEAQYYCPLIQARSGAPSGGVHRRAELQDPVTDRWYDSDPESWSEDHLVLSRNNAPLFRAVLRYVRSKRPCRVLTNAIESLISFIHKIDATTSLEFLAKLDLWYRREREAAEKLGFKGKIAALQDKYETLQLLAKSFSTPREIIQMLDHLSNGRTGTTFSTIHRAKGLEAPHVYLLRPDLCPSPFATTPDAKQQELNLLYVAITRAQLTFTYGMPLF